MKRWYQTIEIPGVDAVFEDVNRMKSKFWDEGKWNTFIKPLLPKERQTFIEIGCNAGLFLKMATDEGFKRVIGVESCPKFIQHAKIVKESFRGSWKIINQTAGKDLDLDDLPVSDIILLSDMHYYLSISDFSKLVDRLKNRTLYCIVVSGRANMRPGLATWELGAVRGYFREWFEVDTIERVNPEGDCAPRIQMFGTLFKGGLSSLNVDRFYDNWINAAKSQKHKAHKLAPAIRTFFSLVLSGEKFVYEDMDFYNYWVSQRMKKKGTTLSSAKKQAHDILLYKESIAKDIQKNGMKDPVYLEVNRRGLLNGYHRLTIAKLLGHKHIICRRL